MKINKSERASVRVRPDILELAREIKKERGYSMGDIFEMGVLLLDNNNENDLIIQEKMYNEMIKRFSDLEESVHKECEHIENRILKEIQDLECVKKGINRSLEEKGLSCTHEKVVEVVDSIMKIIELREENSKVGLSLDPLGKEMFEYKSKNSGVPVELILEELRERGYDKKALKNININPEIKWRGYVESKGSLV